MKIRAQKDFWSGVMFLAFAVVAIAAASGYSLGRAGRMGPGYFPLALGIALAILGAIVTGRSLIREGEPIERISLGPIALMTAAVLLFAVSIVPLGLIVSIALSTFVLGFSGRDARWIEIAALAVFLIGLIVVIFVYLLRLPIPVWPAL